MFRLYFTIVVLFIKSVIIIVFYFNFILLCIFETGLNKINKDMDFSFEWQEEYLARKGPFTLAIFAAISQRVNYWRFRGDLNRQ